MTGLLWVLWPLGRLSDGWSQVYPNLVASGICFLAGYLVGIRPHFKRVNSRLDHLHRKVDQLPTEGSTAPADEVR